MTKFYWPEVTQCGWQDVKVLLMNVEEEFLKWWPSLTVFSFIHDWFCLTSLHQTRRPAANTITWPFQFGGHRLLWSELLGVKWTSHTKLTCFHKHLLTFLGSDPFLGYPATSEWVFWSFVGLSGLGMLRKPLLIYRHLWKQSKVFLCGVFTSLKWAIFVLMACSSLVIILSKGHWA